MRKITFVLFMLLCIIKVGAQEVSASDEAAKKKEINSIKLGEQAVYAEVYEVAADDEAALRLAQQKSVNMLEARVIEASAEQMGMSKEDMKAIFDVIDDKCQNIVIRKGDMIRVFSYIMKDKVGLSRKKLSSDDLEEYFGEDNDTVAVKKQLEAVVDKVMDGQDSINVVAHQLEKEILPFPEDTIVVKKESEVMDNKGEEKVVVVEEPKKEEVKPVEEEVIAPAPEVLVPELCQKLIATQNWKSLTKFLAQEKAKNTLMWGSSNKMQFHEKCYIVVVERTNQTIVAVLDKGASDRMNFVSKKMDHFRNYKGGNYSCVFVQEY